MSLRGINLPIGMRVMAAMTLGCCVLGVLNWAFWQSSILGLSQKQMLMFSFVPGFIFSLIALEHPAVRQVTERPNE